MSKQPTLVLISKDDSQNRVNELLLKTCNEKSISAKILNPNAIDFTSTEHQLKPGDMLYRSTVSASISTSARTLERFLVTPQIATFYSTYERALSRYPSSYLTNYKAGLPTPKTILFMTRDRARIKKYVDHVGGFPVVLKATGGSHGVGVMKIDSHESLLSIVDYLHSNETHLYLRQYIAVSKSARLIVLNGQVIASHEYTAPPNDFRSNVGDLPQVQAKDFPAAVQELAIKAVEAQDLKFGGVDILIDQNNQPYVAEVNFPCNFARTQDVTGTDIASHIVNYLLTRSRRLQAS